MPKTTVREFAVLIGEVYKAAKDLDVREFIDSLAAIENTFDSGDVVISAIDVEKAFDFGMVVQHYKHIIRIENPTVVMLEFVDLFDEGDYGYELIRSGVGYYDYSKAAREEIELSLKGEDE